MLRFQDAFRDAYGYVSLVICLFGMLNNVVNTVILTRKEMRSATNTILTGLAVADLLVMLEYIPYTCHDYILYSRGEPDKHTYEWALFVLFHAHFGQIFHTISIWLTVALAMWRLVYIKLPVRSVAWCTQKKAILSVCACYLIPPVLCFPVYLSLRIRSVTTRNGSELYVVDGLSGQGKTFRTVNFWTYGMFVKLIPCFLLTVIIICLIEKICETSKKKRLVLNDANRNSSSRNPRKALSHRQKERTTTMLLCVLMLFLITELPQGILSLLSALFGKRFYLECVRHLDEILDLLALINSSINFILYCCMSSQFRKMFKELYNSYSDAETGCVYAPECETRSVATTCL